MKRLLLLALATGAAALVLALIPRDRGPEPEAAAPARPVARARVELTPGGMNPYRLSVPKDHELHLVVQVAPEAAEGVFAITGYEHRVGPVHLGPGLSRELVFTTDRPGDDFAFLLNGELVGRLEVTGSHLVEGHR